MNCTNIQADLSAFLDGELGEGRTQEVYQHLVGCAGCRQSSEAMQAASVAFRELAPSAVSADFAAGMAGTSAVPVDAPGMAPETTVAGGNRFCF